MLHGLSIYLTAVFILIFLFLIVRFVWQEPNNKIKVVRFFGRLKGRLHPSIKSNSDSPHANDHDGHADGHNAPTNDEIPTADHN